MVTAALFVVLVVGVGSAALFAVRRATGVRRSLTIVAIAVGTVPVLAVLGFGAAHVVNSWRLARFSAQLFTHPLPPGAREIGRRTELGLLAGDGNHCDFVATQELATTLPIEAVRAHYARLRLRPAIGAGTGRLEIEVAPHAAGGGVVVVTAVDAPYEDIFDLRCS